MFSFFLNRHLVLEDELFTVSRLDVTGDGFDEIVACGWSGNTYIINHKKECVRFVLDEPVGNFVAGYFGPNHAPCFVYQTFKNRLLVYPEVEVGHLATRTFGDAVCS